ncbi:MAG TPA: hypothetical protein VKT82_22535 [Ktedonobacterales bacterium]|nr:hypothetical protein [Ktedonobacterales bacterium]
MIEGYQSADVFPEQEIRNVAKAWASSYGYNLEEPMTIVPLLTLVPDDEQIMSARLEGWTIFAQARRKASGQEVTVLIPLKRLANSVVPEEEPQEC